MTKLEFAIVGFGDKVAGVNERSARDAGLGRIVRNEVMGVPLILMVWVAVRPSAAIVFTHSTNSAVDNLRIL
jgi:hypothetical protein